MILVRYNYRCIVQDMYGHGTREEWRRQLHWHLTHHLALLARGGWARAGAATRQGGRRPSSAILLSLPSVSRRISASKLMGATTHQHFLVSVYECVPSRIDPWSVSSSALNCLTQSKWGPILCRHFFFAASAGSPLELIQMITRYQILQPAAWRLNLHTLSWKILCTEKCSKQLRWHGISYSLPWLLLLRGSAHLTAFSERGKNWFDVGSWILDVFNCSCGLVTLKILNEHHHIGLLYYNSISLIF